MAPPAGQRLPEAVGVFGVDPDKGRRAGAAVEVFVAAADREVGLRRVEVHRHGARAVREVPDGEHAGRMRGGGDGGHVVHGAGAVVDVGQHQHGDLVGERRGDLFRLDELQAKAALAAQRFGDVEVGREVAALADDELALGCVLGRDVQRGAQHLVEVDGSAVGGHHFAGRRAYQPGNLVAQALRQLEPAGAVPGADQALAPFGRHRLGDAGGGGGRQHAQRVAVEVDHAFGQRELPAQVAQRVLRIEGAAVLQSGHHFFIQGSSRRMARTGEASALVSLSGRAISS